MRSFNYILIFSSPKVTSILLAMGVQPQTIEGNTVVRVPALGFQKWTVDNDEALTELQRYYVGGYTEAIQEIPLTTLDLKNLR